MNIGSIDERLPDVTEAEPRLDASRPSVIRISGFVLTAAGAALMWLGAVAIWVTVGIPNESAHTEIHGTDLADGKVAAFCSFAVLVAMIVTRLVRARRTRVLLAALTLIASLTGALIGLAFIATGTDRGPVLEALGVPKDVWSRFGAFRDLGPGSPMVVAGGILALGGGVLTLLWARRTVGATVIVR